MNFFFFKQPTMHLILRTKCCYNLVEIHTCNFTVKCFQAPAGEVAEDDGEHGKNIIL